MTTAPFFHMIGSEARERIVKLTGTTLIGRATDNTIVLDDQTISQYHVMVLIQPEGVFLMDLESTNGTAVNTVPALPDELVHLTDGDVITIGEMALHYQAPSLQP
jgi:pSer/pThr/pTyr-binding forkhead associated (FHA) protein